MIHRPVSVEHDHIKGKMTRKLLASHGSRPIVIDRQMSEVGFKSDPQLRLKIRGNEDDVWIVRSRGTLCCVVMVDGDGLGEVEREKEE